MSNDPDPRRKKEIVTLAIVFTAVLLVSALAVYFIAGNRSAPETATPEASRQDSQANDAIREPTITERRPPASNNTANENFLDRLFSTRQSDARVGGARWGDLAWIAVRLLLAALLGAALAFRPRRRPLILKRNPYVSQTQILLAIVAAALMIIVGDNAARAFGIFAAVSLVRFRTNIRDPKEITVLLISLALGLAAGVGRWDLAIILAAFALAVLWLLESREPRLVFRSMEVKVASKDVVSTQRALRQVFKKNNFDAELRAIGREDAKDSLGRITYAVDISPNVNTDQLSEEILSLDEENIEGIEWAQKKSYSYLYQ
jgi:uncharacterized membrane protein YhiD involved in acid resistance